MHMLQYMHMYVAEEWVPLQTKPYEQAPRARDIQSQGFFQLPFLPLLAVRRCAREFTPMTVARLRIASRYRRYSEALELPQGPLARFSAAPTCSVLSATL
jgi:hypothetical protein